MTANDWNFLEKAKCTRIEERATRDSSVQFDLVEPVPGSKRNSQRSSILKKSSLESENQLNLKQNAFHPIQAKCREAMKNMKIESVLKILCDDDDFVRTENPQK